MPVADYLLRTWGLRCSPELSKAFSGVTSAQLAGNVALQDRMWEKFTALAPQEDYPATSAVYKYLFSSRDRMKQGPPIVWRPDPKTVAEANMTKLMRHSGTTSMADLHQWTIRNPEAFWQSFVKDRVTFRTRPTSMLSPEHKDYEHPVWFPGAELNIVESCLRGDPSRPAIVFSTEVDPTLRQWSLGELRERVHRIAVGLREKCGLRKGDPVGILMPMNPESVAIYLGIVAAGGVVVSIADSFVPSEVATRLRIAGCKLMFTVDCFTRGGKPVDLLTRAIEAGTSRLVIVKGDARSESKPRPEDLSFDSLMDLGHPLRDFEYAIGDAYQTTNILFSSGTTGDPKAVLWNQLAPLRSASEGYHHMDIHKGEVVMWPTNLGWMMGPFLIYASLLNEATMALYVGLPGGPEMGRFVQQAKVARLGVIPAMVKNWARSRCMDGFDWSAVRVVGSTGERSDEEYIYLLWLTKFRSPVAEVCGGTELGAGYVCSSVVQPNALNTFSTPSLGAEMVVLSPTEDGSGYRLTEVGEEGEAFIVPPMLGSSQRLLNADHHKVYFEGAPRHPVTGAKLRRHGDILRVLPGGYYDSQGRADDTMNLGGIKTSCGDLERVTNAHPLVLESAAVAVQAPGGSADMLVLFIVLKDESSDTSKLKSQLQAQIASELNPLFRIHDVVVVSAMPKTPTFKIIRRSLRSGYRVKGAGTAPSSR
eukprot:RCo016514